MLKLLAAPVTNERTPRHMERALAAIHQTIPAGEPITLIYGTVDGRVALCLRVADRFEDVVTGPIAANYPNCSLTTVGEIDGAPSGWLTWYAALVLQPDLFPILRHAQFEDLLNRAYADPLSAILRAIKPDDNVRCRIELRVTPVTSRRKDLARHAVRNLDREFFRRHARLAGYYARHITRPRGRLLARLLEHLARHSPHAVRSSLDTSAGRLHDREERLQAAADKVGGHLFEAQIRLIAHARPGDSHLAADRIRQMAGAFGAFTQSRLATFHLGHIRCGSPAAGWQEGSLFSHEELCTLFHPPTASVDAEAMQSLEFRELEPPPSFSSGKDPGAAALGQVLFRADTRLIGIDQDARRRHVYIVGSTGAGKSTLLLNLIHQDMLAGRGLTVIDVHGDLVDAALELVPTRRTNETIVFDAAADSVVPFNPLACTEPSRIDQVTSGAVSAFKKLYDSWGPRLESLLRSAVYVTVEQGGTLLDMLRLLTDKSYRDQILTRVSDPIVRLFWLNEFATWSTQYRTEAVSSVTNKLMPFLTSPKLRAITTAPASDSLNLRRIMDEKGILLVNISRGRIGQDNATLLGSLLLTAIEQAAMSRAELPEQNRLDHALYLDEFQTLQTPSTAIMLSEARKYRLSLILSHQLTRQLDPATYHAVIGNCATIIAFRVGLEDAELLAPALSKHPDQLTAADLSNLPNYTAYARLLVRGHPSSPFSLRTLPPVSAQNGDQRGDIVRRTSERRYAMPVSSAPVSARRSLTAS